jgi:hypothetical protein
MSNGHGGARKGSGAKKKQEKKVNRTVKSKRGGVRKGAGRVSQMNRERLERNRKKREIQKKNHDDELLARLAGEEALDANSDIGSDGKSPLSLLSFSNINR